MPKFNVRYTLHLTVEADTEGQALTKANDLIEDADISIGTDWDMAYSQIVESK